LNRGSHPEYRLVMKLPQSFLDLHAAGRFDYWGGKPYHDMDDAERARLLAERRTEVLWLRNIEWDVPLEDVAELDWTRPGLFGFAGNGGGDAYAFYPAWQGDAAEPPVILVAHDDSSANVFAPTFALALYRLWLEHGSAWDEDEDGDDRESALRAWAGIIAPFLEPDTRATLEALAVDLGPSQLSDALDAFEESLPSDELETTLPPTRYDPAYVKGEEAAEMYAESIAFFDALVEEGHERFRRHAEEARANRDAAAKRAERKAKPVKAGTPKAKPAKKAAPKKAKPAKRTTPKKAAKAKPAKKAVEKAIEKALVTAAKAVGKAVKKAATAVKKAAKKKAAKKAKPARKAAPKKAVPKKKAAPKKAVKKAAKAKPAKKAAKPAKKRAR
jgi:hypothetical protein